MGVHISCHRVSTADIALQTDDSSNRSFIIAVPAHAPRLSETSVSEHVTILEPPTNDRVKSGHNTWRRGSRNVSDVDSSLPTVYSPLSVQPVNPVLEGESLRLVSFLTNAAPSTGTCQSDSMMGFRVDAGDVSNDGAGDTYANPLGITPEDRRASVRVHHTTTTPILQRAVCCLTFDGEPLTSQGTWPVDPAGSGSATLPLELPKFHRN